MKEKTTGYSQSSYGGYQSQGNPYGGQGNPYGNQQGNPYGEWNPFEDILDNLVAITQMVELSKDRRQRQDMRRTRI